MAERISRAGMRKIILGAMAAHLRREVMIADLSEDAMTLAWEVQCELARQFERHAKTAPPIPESTS